MKRLSFLILSLCILLPTTARADDGGSPPDLSTVLAELCEEHDGKLPFCDEDVVCDVPDVPDEEPLSCAEQRDLDVSEDPALVCTDVDAFLDITAPVLSCRVQKRVCSLLVVSADRCRKALAKAIARSEREACGKDRQCRREANQRWKAAKKELRALRKAQRKACDCDA